MRQQHSFRQLRRFGIQTLDDTISKALLPEIYKYSEPNYAKNTSRTGKIMFWRVSFLFFVSGCWFFSENSFVQYRNPTTALLVFTVNSSGMAFRQPRGQRPQGVTF